jgi:hypothetical protein
VGGDVNGENSGPLVPGVTAGELFSQFSLENELFLLRVRFSGGVDGPGKHELQLTGLSCVYRTVVGPWVSQKCAREI